MLSLKLWRAVNRPPLRSPLLRRAYMRRDTSQQFEPLRIPLLEPVLELFRTTGLIVLPVILIIFGAPILALLYYLSLVLAPFLLPVIYTAYGLSHTSGASGRIAREREQQTYDLLGTAPSGILGLHWSYCTGWLHQHAGYRYLLLATLATGIAASVFGLSPQLIFATPASSVVVSVLRAGAMGCIFILDYLQTPVVSSLTTLIVPAYAENEGNARLLASSLYLLVQLGVYLPTLLLGTFALPSLFTLVQADPVLADFASPVLLLAFFALLRESVIVGLWQRVQEQLSASTMELDAITHAAV